MRLTNFNRPGGNRFINGNNAEGVEPRAKLLLTIGCSANHDLHPSDQANSPRFVPFHLSFRGFDLVQIVNEDTGVKQSVYHSDRNLSW
jgi:hypothetical protein